MIPHLLRYQGLAVDDGGLSRFISGASPLMPRIWGILDFRSFRVIFIEYFRIVD